jgi:pyruvate dehydrogenase E2 component (dihydrolipoamide acetyltransferase)
MATIEVKVPALGDYKDVPVIDVLVKPGDEVKPDDGLITLESDKATMDVPAPAAGKVKAVSVKVGDRVSEGAVVLTLESADGKADKADGAPAQARAAERKPAAEARRAEPPPQRGEEPPQGKEEARPPASAPKRAAEAAAPRGGVVEVKVPALGDYKDVPVIDVLVKPGDTVTADSGLLTLESDKATMDVPAPSAGTVKEVRIKVGDRVSEGTVVLLLEPAGAAAEGEVAKQAEPSASLPSPPPGERARERGQPEERRPSPQPSPLQGEGAESTAAAPRAEAKPAAARVHASPTVRKLARELGVDLGQVKGSGPKGRILHQDVQAYVKEVMSGAAVARDAGPGLSLPPWPKVDFAKFGPVETKPLTRIQKIAGPALARNWVMIPHVTQFDEADVTDLEAFRVQLNEEGAKTGVKVTILAFLVKACVAALRRFPEVNSSLEGDHLVLKRYFHIGFAADTPNGLVVPVVKNADQKGVVAIAQELAELAAKAREGKLQAADLQGGSFSISSLGGIGGTAFTPIVNAPEVAILGVSRAATRPVWDGKAFVPRLLLPLSLSYDHRVVDGALAARFTTFLAQILADMRRAML